MMLAWDEVSGRDDSRQRFRIYRSCLCERCGGEGKTSGIVPDTARERCSACRGEGRVLELVATCTDEESVGVALCHLGREGEFEDCPVGVLDSAGESGRKWIFQPWFASPRNLSDAGRTLASARESVRRSRQRKLQTM